MEPKAPLCASRDGGPGASRPRLRWVFSVLGRPPAQPRSRTPIPRLRRRRLLPTRFRVQRPRPPRSRRRCSLRLQPPAGSPPLSRASRPPHPSRRLRHLSRPPHPSRRLGRPPQLRRPSPLPDRARSRKARPAVGANVISGPPLPGGRRLARGRPWLRGWRPLDRAPSSGSAPCCRARSRAKAHTWAPSCSRRVRCSPSCWRAARCFRWRRG